MNLVQVLRAKSEKEGEEGRNILLVDHIMETLHRAKQLKEFVEANADTITYLTLKDENFFTTLAVALTLHDFGKINYDFQKRVHDMESDSWKVVKDFLKPIREVKLRHEILSAIWASIILEDTDEWKEWFSKIRTAILLHHYNEYYVGMKDLTEIVHNHFEDVKKYVEFIVNNKQKFEEFLNCVVNQIRKKFSNCNFMENATKIIQNYKLERAEKLLEMIKNREDDLSEFAEFYEIDNENPDYNFLVFLGCLRRCDYSASGEVELEKMDEDKKPIKFEELYKNLAEKMKSKIGCEPDWQKMILEKLKLLNSVVLIAPTGAGKTEFALLWNSKNKRKLIYALPLRVALNDLFHRFKDHYFNEDSVDILHSTAFIEYLKEEQRGERQINVGRQLTSAELLSSPILLTTPDQVFLTSLNYYGSDKIVAVYPLSSIVIDEIQTYDPEMASIIIKTLKIVEKLNGSVLIMTATLPPYFEPFFFEDKSGDYDIPEKFKLKFERIDTKEIRNYVKNYNLKRHKIDVVDVKLKNNKNNKYTQYLSKLKGSLLDRLSRCKSDKVLIVLNNVSKAIELYKELKKKKDMYSNVFLLHSRLIEKEKDRRIKEIKKKLDKKEQVIVVATQIIEASVDLDFDVMLTEVSPIDSQVQRWGRVYRNREKDYDKELPNILVFVGKSENGEIKIDRGTYRIYDIRVVEKTIEVLENCKGKILSYEDEKKMIDEVFEKAIDINDPEIAKEINRENIKLKDLYVAEIKRNLDFLKYFSVEKKHQAQKLFRRIAGIQVVIPAVMKIDGDETVKSFAEIIEDPESDKLTWKEIEEKVGVNKWTLKKMLYEYSVNIPVFYWEYLEQLNKHEFKGFHVIRTSDRETENVLEYGVDIIFKKSEEDFLENLL